MCRLQHILSFAGMYDIHIKFNDAHIPGSPFRVHISPDSGVARNVTVHSLKDRGLQVQFNMYNSVCTNRHHGYVCHIFCLSSQWFEVAILATFFLKLYTGTVKYK